MTKGEVFAPVVEKFLVIAGAPAAANSSSTSDKGLAFRTPSGSRRKAVASRCKPPHTSKRAWLSTAQGTFTFENCEIGHVAPTRSGSAKGAAIAQSATATSTISGRGVRIGETWDRRATRPSRPGTSRSTITSVRDGGSIFPCAVGVAGGAKRRQPGHAQRNRQSLLHGHLGRLDLGLQGETSPAEYHLLQPCPSSRLVADERHGRDLHPRAVRRDRRRNNVFHDIYAFSYGGWGMYTDEGSTGELFENNLVLQHQDRAASISTMARKTSCGTISWPSAKCSRCRPRGSRITCRSTLENNLVYWGYRPSSWAGPWDKLRFVSRNISSGRAPARRSTSPASRSPSGRPRGTNKDRWWRIPKFGRSGHGDYHLALDSPALKLGFKPFDYAQAGVYGDAAWVAKAREVKYPQWTSRRRLRRWRFTRTSRPGNRAPVPAAWCRHVENRGDAIVVTDETAAGGKRCLKIVGRLRAGEILRPHLTFERTSGYPVGHGPQQLRREDREELALPLRSGATTASRSMPRGDFSIRDGQLTVPKGPKVAPAERAVDPF